MDWAGLLRRTSALDVFVCSLGGVRRRVLAYLRAPCGVGAIVEHLGLVFHANLWRKGGADFVRLQVDRATRSISVEVIDGGWFEIAASLG